MARTFLKLMFRDTNRSKVFELDHNKSFDLSPEGMIFNTHQPRIAIFYKKPPYTQIILQSPPISMNDHVLAVPDLWTHNTTYFVYVPNESFLKEPDGTKKLMVTQAINKKWIGYEDATMQNEIDTMEKELKELKAESLKMFRRFLKFVETSQEDMVDLGIEIETTVKDGQRMLKRIAQKKSKTEREEEEMEELGEQLEDTKLELTEVLQNGEKEEVTQTG